MKSFVDNSGRRWLIQIHVAAVKRLRGLLDVDLYGLIDEEFAGLGKLMSDPVKLVDVIYCLCKDEADKLGVTDEDFGRAMGGDCLTHAADAFLGELTDFFPDARVRTGLHKILSMSRKVRDTLLTQAMEQMDQEMDRIDVESLVEKLKSSSGNSPESSESIPIHSRSAS